MTLTDSTSVVSTTDEPPTCPTTDEPSSRCDRWLTSVLRPYCRPVPYRGEHYHRSSHGHSRPSYEDGRHWSYSVSRPQCWRASLLWMLRCRANLHNRCLPPQETPCEPSMSLEWTHNGVSTVAPTIRQTVRSAPLSLVVLDSVARNQPASRTRSVPETQNRQTAVDYETQASDVPLATQRSQPHDGRLNTRTACKRQIPTSGHQATDWPYSPISTSLAEPSIDYELPVENAETPTQAIAGATRANLSMNTDSSRLDSQPHDTCLTQTAASVSICPVLYNRSRRLRQGERTQRPVLRAEIAGLQPIMKISRSSSRSKSTIDYRPLDRLTTHPERSQPHRPHCVTPLLSATGHTVTVPTVVWRQPSLVTRPVMPSTSREYRRTLSTKLTVTR